MQVVSRPATFTAADANQLGITDQIGDFTTQYIPGEPRVTNIQHAAETIDGTILQPGEAFDLNQRLGERTIEKGYVVAPMIDEGRLRDAVGGGVSQIATTVFNAAYRAGLEIVTHTPHEFWIPRYPQGQEATVSWGGPELIFRNDWSAPLVLIAEAGPGAITVRIFSQDLDRRVETGIDPPRDPKPAETREVVNSELEPGAEEIVQHGGQEGFIVDYWRKVWRGDELIRDERYSHKYRPEDTIVEKGPEPEKPPEDTTGTGPTESGGTGPTESGPPPSSEGPAASEPPASSQEPAPNSRRRPRPRGSRSVERAPDGADDHGRGGRAGGDRVRDRRHRDRSASAGRQDTVRGRVPPLIDLDGVRRDVGPEGRTSRPAAPPGPQRWWKRLTGTWSPSHARSPPSANTIASSFAPGPRRPATATLVHGDRPRRRRRSASPGASSSAARPSGAVTVVAPHAQQTARAAHAGVTAARARASGRLAHLPAVAERAGKTDRPQRSAIAAGASAVR